LRETAATQNVDIFELLIALFEGSLADRAVVFGYRLSPFEAISDCGLPMSARIKTT
jgi:hypothetical protein